MNAVYGLVAYPVGVVLADRKRPEGCCCAPGSGVLVAADVILPASRPNLWVGPVRGWPCGGCTWA